MMTVILWTVAGLVGAYAVFNLGVLKERNRHTVEQKTLPESATDSELVRAIREGELGIEELREAGFDRVVERTPKDNQNEGLQHVAQLSQEAASVSAPDAAPEYKWRPLPMRRSKPPEFLKDAIRGEEFWIELGDLHYDKDGRVHIWHTANLHHTSDTNVSVRVRVLEQGIFEVAVPCGAQGAFSDLLTTAPAFYLEVYRVRKYANTKWVGGDPLKRFKSLSEREKLPLMFGGGPHAYVVPFYPED